MESRDGAVRPLLVSVNNLQEILDQRDAKTGSEFASDVAKRPVSVVEPIDMVAYFDEGQFGEIFVQSKLAQCDADCYQHIFDGNNKAYKTSVGHIDAEIAISLKASMVETEPPNMDTLIAVASSKLNLAKVAKKSW